MVFFLPLFQCWNFLNVNYLSVRVVTYISRVEAFVTRIKIESSNQSPFWELIRVASEPWKSKLYRIKTYSYNLTFDLLKIKRSRDLEGNNQAIKYSFCQSKRLILVANTSTGDMHNLSTMSYKCLPLGIHSNWPLCCFFFHLCRLPQILEQTILIVDSLIVHTNFESSIFFVNDN